MPINFREVLAWNILCGRFGLKVFGEYNYDFGDELDGLILGDSNVSFYRLGVGFNFYFGGEKQKQKRLSKKKL